MDSPRTRAAPTIGARARSAETAGTEAAGFAARQVAASITIEAPPDDAGREKNLRPRRTCARAAQGRPQKPTSS